MNTTNLIKIVPLVVAMVGLAMAQYSHATDKGPAYNAGYKHGVSDARIERMNPTSHSLYIVQPGKNLYDHTQNFTWGYMDGYCSLQSCPGVESGATKNKPGSPPLDPGSFNAGLQYGLNDWNQRGDTNQNYTFECPLAKPYWHSNFCNGYDAALVWENSDY
jgi:hypothetical protein